MHAETEEQHVLYTVCLFTYVAELCKNVQVESHRIVADNVIVVLKIYGKGSDRHVFVSANERSRED